MTDAYERADRMAFDVTLEELIDEPSAELREIAKQDSIVGQAAQRILTLRGSAWQESFTIPDHLCMHGKVVGMARKHLKDVRRMADRIERAHQDLHAAIWHAVKSGESYRDIGQCCGLSHTRVGQLYKEEERRRTEAELA